VLWTRVKEDGSANTQGCASALNGNGNVVGGGACTTTGLRATNYYDGSRFLKGLNKNNTRFFAVFSGNELY